MELKKMFQIEYLNAKAAFFFAASAKYTLMSFLVVFLTNNGLKIGHAGFTVAIRLVIEVIGGVVMNFLIDKFPKHIRKIVLSSITTSSVFLFSLPWYTRIHTSLSNHLIAYAVANGIAAFFDGGIIASIDSRVIYITNKVSQTLYRKQRIWVSIGLGFTPFVTGVVLQKCRGHYFENEALFFVLLTCHLCLLISCYSLFKEEYKNDDKLTEDENKLTIDTTHKDDLAPNKSQSNKNEVVYKREPTQQNKSHLVLALLSYLFVGMGFMFQYTFVFLLLEIELDASKTIMGLGALLQALSEVFSCSFGCKLVKYFKDDTIPLSFTYFGFALAFFAYYFVEKIWLMMLVNMIVGVSYSTFVYPAADIIYKNTKETNRGVVFAVALALLNGVGGCIASLLGGYLFQVIGGRKTFFGGASWFVMIGIIFLAISLKMSPCFKKGENTKEKCIVHLNDEQEMLSI